MGKGQNHHNFVVIWTDASVIIAKVLGRDQVPIKLSKADSHVVQTSQRGVKGCLRAPLELEPYL